MTRMLTRVSVIVAAAVLSLGFTTGAAHADISWGGVVAGSSQVASK